MIIEFELQGSQLLHKGLFDTTGFWAKFDVDKCDITGESQSYKIYSHFSFSFEHVDRKTALEVYQALVNAISGIDSLIFNVGYFREIC